MGPVLGHSYTAKDWVRLGLLVSKILHRNEWIGTNVGEGCLKTSALGFVRFCILS